MGGAGWIERTSSERLVPVRYDGIGRPVAEADYGITDFVRTTVTSPPDSSDSVLVSRTRYNDWGEAFEQIDPSGMINRSEFDDAGRETEQFAEANTLNPSLTSGHGDIGPHRFGRIDHTAC